MTLARSHIEKVQFCESSADGAATTTNSATVIYVMFNIVKNMFSLRVFKTFS